MGLQEVINNLIAGCGTVGDVATKLSIMGCKGIPTSQHMCPIAVYLRGELDNHSNAIFSRVTVADTSVTMGDDLVGLPRLLHDFVIQFDNGIFPELIKETVCEHYN